MTPEIRAAIDRARQFAGLFTINAIVAEAEFAAAGIHPVSVVHGDPETQADAALIHRLPALADEAGRRAGSRGGNDYTTFLFASEQAADGFVAALAALSLPRWWRVTLTAVPQFGRPR